MTSGEKEIITAEQLDAELTRARRVLATARARIANYRRAFKAPGDRDLNLRLRSALRRVRHLETLTAIRSA